MPSVLTITMNPSVDKTISVPAMMPDRKMHSSAPSFQPGGGGINVARGISRLGGEVVAIYPVGGYHGKLLTDLLKEEKVTVMPIEMKTQTREGWVVDDISQNKQYRFVMPGAALTESIWNECLEEVESAEGVSFVVFSGSVPGPVRPDFFSDLLKISNRKGARLVVDSSGEALIQAVRNGVYLIKPSINEMGILVKGLELKNKSLPESGQEIIGLGLCEVIIVSMGHEGAMLITKDLELKIPAPQVKKMSTVGAGDSMVAGIIHSLLNKKGLEEAFKFGVACGSAATMNQGTSLFKPADVEELLRMIHKESPQYCNNA
ncbi:MAG: 1-phosphofructokinase family hexose kinase [Chitinophagales bacterium]